MDRWKLFWISIILYTQGCMTLNLVASYNARRRKDADSAQLQASREPGLESLSVSSEAKQLTQQNTEAILPKIKNILNKTSTFDAYKLQNYGDYSPQSVKKFSRKQISNSQLAMLKNTNTSVDSSSVKSSQLNKPSEHLLHITTESENVIHSTYQLAFRNLNESFPYRYNIQAKYLTEAQKTVPLKSVRNEDIVNIRNKKSHTATLSRGRRTELRTDIQHDTSTEMFFQSRNKKIQKNITRDRLKNKNRWNENGSLKGWIEYDFDEGTSTTTKDPLLPENPVGLKNPNLLVGPWIEEPTIRKSKARFGGNNDTTVSAQNGTTANLPCVILGRDDHETVSWIRYRDHHLITVGRQTFSSDDRFSVNFNRHLNRWTLHLRYVQPRDAGRYICQLSTDPVMVAMVQLTVTEASSSIRGAPERYVHEGSSVRLECALARHTQAPEYVFWYHNKSMINYDVNRKVRVDETPDGSILTLLSVGRTDSGNYTCSPANAQQASITLHIILGDTLAAMKVSAQPPAASPLHSVGLVALLLVSAHCL